MKHENIHRKFYYEDFVFIPQSKKSKVHSSKVSYEILTFGKKLLF